MPRPLLHVPLVPWGGQFPTAAGQRPVANENGVP